MRPYESELINAPQSGFNYSKLLGINSARVMTKRQVGLDDKKKDTKKIRFKSDRVILPIHGLRNI